MKRIFHLILPILRIFAVMGAYALLLFIHSRDGNLNSSVYNYNGAPLILSQTSAVFRYIYPHAALFAFFQFVFINSKSTAEKYFGIAGQKFNFFGDFLKLSISDISTVLENVSFLVIAVWVSLNFKGDVFLIEAFYKIGADLGIAAKIANLCIICGIYLLSKRSAMARWFEIKNRSEYYKTNFFKTIAAIVGFAVRFAVITLGAFFITLFSNMIGTALLIIIRHPLKFLQFLLAVAVVAVLHIVYSYIRAFIKRVSFLRKLKKASVAEGYEINIKNKPLLSVFFNRDGFEISVFDNGEIYDCKFIAGIKRRNDMIFLDSGEVKILHELKFGKRTDKVAIFSYSKYQKYTFDSENKKIIIVSPCPNCVCAAQSDTSKPIEIDTGFDMFEYKIYNGAGFLSALEYGCINKKYQQ